VLIPAMKARGVKRLICVTGFESGDSRESISFLQRLCCLRGRSSVRLVDNLSRPGANITDVNSMQAELGAKRLQLLHMLRPQAKRFGLLVNPQIPAVEEDIAIAQKAVKDMALSLEVLSATTSREIDTAFAEAIKQRVETRSVWPVVGEG
jgi:hypothetical protein